MRKVILLIFTALIMIGCDTRTEEQRYNDYLQKQKENNMAHLIDKDTLVVEIERLQCPEHKYCLDKLLDFLDTLEVKEVDLDNFVKEEFNKYSCVDGYGQLSVSYNMAEFYGMIKRLTKAQKGE